MAHLPSGLLALDGLSRGTIEGILDAADALVPSVGDAAARPAESLRGRLVANVFLEDSTRTRASFTVAAHRLGATTLDITTRGSSVSKGETLVDTARNLEAMGADAIVVRTPTSGGPALVARVVACPVFNGGDGRHEHPTQGLLDILTMRRHLGSLEGRRVLIVGDVGASRVARSNLHGLTTLGADVDLVGPPPLVQPGLACMTRGPGQVRVGHDLDAALAERPDVVMVLRVQFERGSGVTTDYRDLYGLTEARAGRLPDALVMHPGPMNRGLEIDSAVADDGGRSLILEQVRNGVAVRMAILEAALGTPRDG